METLEHLGGLQAAAHTLHGIPVGRVQLSDQRVGRVPSASRAQRWKGCGKEPFWLEYWEARGFCDRTVNVRLRCQAPLIREEGRFGICPTQTMAPAVGHCDLRDEKAREQYTGNSIQRPALMLDRPASLTQVSGPAASPFLFLTPAPEHSAHRPTERQFCPPLQLCSCSSQGRGFPLEWQDLGVNSPA